ncbi:MAG: carbohydrate ABC transporter permease [Candidatus Pristimantibacillus lignocellulolyticus]|uniref:Carbohydrate ABC transporter permease n=1 Tax=Candidatus Pristimantibacillus lignocellulolyticus TaxID=2994561 RepID=A0A9J6Z9J3_9BACL|nr:MAG: carbohydrate ABC transporter permease [Candidatus Pristimantibacillus lignocellulolyticus]
MANAQLTDKVKISDKLDPALRFQAIKRSKNIIGTIFFYFILLSLSFVFLYPLLYMISKSLMQSWDVADATVRWIPHEFNIHNYKVAFTAMKYWQGFMNSSIISFGSAALQIISCSLIGYGFARYRFPLYGLWFVLLIFTFLVPPQTIVVPLYMFFSELGWINTHLPFIVPAAFGHGLQGSLFILIFIQFYRQLPKVLEEAARIDGAGAFRTYWQIMFPLGKPAMVTVFLFSIVWHWNDNFQPSLYLRLPPFYNLAQRMNGFYGQATMTADQMGASVSSSAIGMAPTVMNQMMAGVVLSIIPILILYLFVQRNFVESVERAGIAGE